MEESDTGMRRGMLSCEGIALRTVREKGGDGVTPGLVNITPTPAVLVVLWEFAFVLLHPATDFP